MPTLSTAPYYTLQTVEGKEEKMNVKFLTDDVEDFDGFIKSHSPYFKLQIGKEWFLLRYSHLDDYFYFYILSGSTDKAPFTNDSYEIGSLGAIETRELRYRYYDEDRGVNIEGNIIVSFSQKGDDQKIIFSIDRYVHGDDSDISSAVRMESVDKSRLPLYMTNCRPEFAQELRNM